MRVFLEQVRRGEGHAGPSLPEEAEGRDGGGEFGRQLGTGTCFWPKQQPARQVGQGQGSDLPGVIVEGMEDGKGGPALGLSYAFAPR